MGWALDNEQTWFTFSVPIWSWKFHRLFQEFTVLLAVLSSLYNATPGCRQVASFVLSDSIEQTTALNVGIGIDQMWHDTEYKQSDSDVSCMFPVRALCSTVRCVPPRRWSLSFPTSRFITFYGSCLVPFVINLLWSCHECKRWSFDGVRLS